MKIPVPALFPLAALLALAADPGTAGAPPNTGFTDGFASIVKKDVELHLLEVASAHHEGRDSPSAGQEAAADYIIERFREAGLVGAGTEGEFRLPFERSFSVPDPDETWTAVTRPDVDSDPLVLERDFVPLPGCEGEAEGPPVFVGFGITDSKERYDDLKKVKLKGTIAVIVEGEPRHRRLFEGPEITEASDVYAKVEDLVDAGAVGVLVVRRPPAEDVKGWDGEPIESPELGYRYTWASFNMRRGRRGSRSPREHDIPVMEITPALAEAIMGEDVLALAQKIDKSGRPLQRRPKDVLVGLASAFETRAVRLDNVVGILPGSDPALAGEYVVVGAHYDHIGVDPWGRIGYGADDNGSGVAAMIEVAQALAEARPPRSILFCGFSAEEDGLHGSRAFVRHSPVPHESMVAMLNLDMIGRGETGEVVVLGAKQNPDLGDVLKKAQRLKSTKLTKVITDRAEHLWQRSDHYSFHEVGVPSLFFFESPSESDNPDYHTFRDTVDRVDFEKVARTARLTYNAAWLLATDEDRPSAPRDH